MHSIVQITEIVEDNWEGQVRNSFRRKAENQSPDLRVYIPLSWEESFLILYLNGENMGRTSHAGHVNYIRLLM